MRVGYARVSKVDQNLDLQIDALQKAECKEIFKDVISGAKTERQGLNEAMKFLREGDTLVVWKLDRLGRSIRHLIEIIQELARRNISFLCLQGNIDTSTSTGKLIFHIFGALAEFERDLIKERTQAGIESARARGRKGGRPNCLNDKQIARLKELHKEGQGTINELCKIFNISRPTFYSYLKPEI